MVLADSDNTVPTAVLRLRVARLGSERSAVASLLQWAAVLTDVDGPMARQRLAASLNDYRPTPV